MSMIVALGYCERPGGGVHVYCFWNILSLREVGAVERFNDENQTSWLSLLVLVQTSECQRSIQSAGVLVRLCIQVAFGMVEKGGRTKEFKRRSDVQLESLYPDSRTVWTRSGTSWRRLHQMARTFCCFRVFCRGPSSLSLARVALYTYNDNFISHTNAEGVVTNKC